MTDLSEAWNIPCFHFYTLQFDDICQEVVR